MTASEILVIFLSVALAVFLVLGIVLTIFLIVIAKKIKNVADSAERTASQFEGVMATLQRAAAPAVISNFIMDTVSKFSKARSKKEEE